MVNMEKYIKQIMSFIWAPFIKFFDRMLQMFFSSNAYNKNPIIPYSTRMKAILASALNSVKPTQAKNPYAYSPFAASPFPKNGLWKKYFDNKQVLIDAVEPS